MTSSGYYFHSPPPPLNLPVSYSDLSFLWWFLVYRSLIQVWLTSSLTTAFSFRSMFITRPATCSRRRQHGTVPLSIHVRLSRGASSCTFAPTPSYAVLQSTVLCKLKYLWDTHASQTDQLSDPWPHRPRSLRALVPPRSPPRIHFRRLLMTCKVLHNLPLLTDRASPTSPSEDLEKNKIKKSWSGEHHHHLFVWNQTETELLHVAKCQNSKVSTHTKNGWNAANVNLNTEEKNEILHFISFSPLWPFWRNIESSFSLVYYTNVSERLFQSSSPSDTDLGHFI